MEMAEGFDILLGEFSMRPITRQWVLAMIRAGVAMAAAGTLFGQPPGAAPAFEVASIKPLESSWLQISPQRSGGRISWRVNLNQLVRYAYHLPSWRVIGMPQSDVMFQIEATADAAASADQIRLMFQSLLASRFQLTAHRETKELNGYWLTVNKGGSKLKQTAPGDPPAPLPEWFAGKDAMIPQIEGKVLATMEGKGIAAITGRRVTMAELADALEQPVGTFVLDKTDLPGQYYFAFKFVRDDAPPDADAPTLGQAVQQLGLRLERERGPVEMLMIDRCEKMPTEN
jgi:uncharacterized protein (TIGR03435 family)